MKTWLKKPSLLMVDDQPENLIVLDKMLHHLPLHLVSATTGEEALRLSLEQEFLLILLDIQMPTMDGYEVAELLSIDEKSRHTPIIFITANFTTHMHKIKGYRSGALDYLTKPIDSEILVSKVKIFLELYQEKQKYKILKRAYKHIALYDHLTQLPNRRFYEKIITDYQYKTFTLLFVDIDHFKFVNDNFGHAVGDELLKMVAQRLATQLNPTDFLARIGGDEFAILIKDKLPLEIEKVAQNLIDSLQKTFSIDSYLLSICISIGIAYYPNQAETITVLKQKADRALYQAKQSGRNTYSVYHSKKK